MINNKDITINNVVSMLYGELNHQLSNCAHLIKTNVINKVEHNIGIQVVDKLGYQVINNLHIK